MRAKFELTNVDAQPGAEHLTFMAVTNKPFDKDRNSEDNSFSKWTPTGNLTMSVTNPDLRGKLKKGEKYYLDFTKAE